MTGFAPIATIGLHGIAVTGAAVSSGGLLAACTSGATSGTTSGATSTAASSGTSARQPRRGGAIKVGLAGGSSSDTLDPHRGLTYLDTGYSHDKVGESHKYM